MFHNNIINPKQALKKRQKILKELRENDFSSLFHTNLDLSDVSNKNCENMVGSVELPVGLVGPVKAKINDVDDEFIIPLATTEGALVASINRGVKLINTVGKAIIKVDRIGMSRAPVFRCQSNKQACDLISWLKDNFDLVSKLVLETSNHLELNEIQGWTRGYLAYVRFVFNSDQAMGMNMVTKAVSHISQKLITKKKSVALISISGNVCCDKKANSLNQIYGRGFRVNVELRVNETALNTILKVGSNQLFQIHHYKNLIGSNVAQSLSQNMHAANMIAAFYIATGQDPAHIVESSQCSIMLDKVADGLYISLDMPNVNVGIIGGGTSLRAQNECINLISDKRVNSKQLAAIVGLAVMCGEMSGLAALVNHELIKAHMNLGRKK